MGSNILSLWLETPSINHTNYPSPCNIYDNAANDTVLIASIPHLFWWSVTQIRKKPVSSCCCSHSIHHHLSFVCDECYIYGALFQLFVPLCHSTSAVNMECEVCLVNRYKQQMLCSNATIFHQLENPYTHHFICICNVGIYTVYVLYTYVLGIVKIKLLN